MSALTTFQAKAMSIALNNMFNESTFFSVCEVRDAANLLGVKLDEKDHAALRLVHCVKYRDMPAGFKQELVDKVYSMLGMQTLVVERVAEAASSDYTDVDIKTPTKAKLLSWLNR